MGKVLVICEKPLQARQLTKPFKHKAYKTHIVIDPCTTFPQGAIFVHAVGHICELALPGEYHEKWKGLWSKEQLPIIVDTFKLKVSPSKQKVFNMIKKYVNDPSISEIIHCGDSGIEGELIVTEILVLLGNKKPIKRLWTSSNAVKKSI